MPLVAAHQLGHAAAQFLGQPEQVGAAVKRVGQDAGVGRDALVLAPIGRHLFADHEAAAHRVILALAQQLPLAIEGGKSQSIGVEWQALALVEHQVLPRVEHHLVPLQHGQGLRLLHLGQPAGDGVHVHRVGFVAHQAQQHGLVRAVPLAGGPQ